MAIVSSGGIMRGRGMTFSQPFPSRAPQMQYADGLTIHYHEIWRSHSSVRTVVSFLGRNIADLGLHVFQRKSDTERLRVTTGPLASVIETPNAYTTRYRWLDELVQDMAIYNQAFYLKVRTEGLLRLIHLSPLQVQVKQDFYGLPTEMEVTYSGTGGQRRVKYKPEDILWLRGYTPDASPLEALRRTLSEEWAAGLMREQILRNGARVSGYIERPKDAGKWSQDVRERFQNAWQAQYAGATADKAGGTPILEDGMVFKPAAQTSEELQYIEARKLTREEVAAQYFIPPPMVGILDHATFSNVKEQHKHLYQDTLGPWLTMLQEDFKLQLVPELAPANTYVEFNLEAKLRGSFEEQATQKSKAIGAPWMTRNEGRALDNLPPIEGGDELITPKNVTEGGASNPTDTAPDDPDNEESNRDQ